METVESIIKTPVESNLLKYSAGRAIFCPNCQGVMDWRRTVVATIHAKTDGKEEKCIRSYVVCAGCWDKLGHTVKEGVAKGLAAIRAKGRTDEVWLETVDGRGSRFDAMD